MPIIMMPEMTVLQSSNTNIKYEDVPKDATSSFRNIVA